MLLLFWMQLCFKCDLQLWLPEVEEEAVEFEDMEHEASLVDESINSITQEC